MDLDIPAYDAHWTGRGGSVPIPYQRVQSRFSEVPARLGSRPDELGESVFPATLNDDDGDAKMMDYKPEPTGYDRMRQQHEESVRRKQQRDETRERRRRARMPGLESEFNGMLVHAGLDQHEDFHHAMERVMYEIHVLDPSHWTTWIAMRNAEIDALEAVRPNNPWLYQQRSKLRYIIRRFHAIRTPGFQPQPRDDS